MKTKEPRPLLELNHWKQMAQKDEPFPDDYVVRKYAASGETEVIKAADGDSKRQVRFTISTAAVDHDNDTIRVAGWDLTVYQKNPTVLWAHDSSELPIAKSIEQTITRKALKSLDEFPEEGINPFADSVYGLIAFGALNAVSAGFKPKEWTYNEDRGGVDFKEQLLLEHSIVPIPSNPEALISAKSAGVMIQPVMDYVERWYWAGREIDRSGLSRDNLGGILRAIEPKIIVVPEIKKRVTSFADLPTAPEDQRWNPRGTADSKLIGAITGDPPNWNRYRKANFWWDGDGGNQAAYKLKFARMFSSSDPGNVAPEGGQLTAIWRQVASRMAILLGARGGVDVPSDERKAIYNHIVKYYKKFDKEPPEFKDYKPDELKEMFPWIYEEEKQNELQIVMAMIKKQGEEIEGLKASIAEIQESKKPKYVLEIAPDEDKQPVPETPISKEEIREVIKESARSYLEESFGELKRETLTALTGRLD